MSTVFWNVAPYSLVEIFRRKQKDLTLLNQQKYLDKQFFHKEDEE
jgi:hypothetical protein